MWTCKKCNEQSEDQFDSCWNCGWGRASDAPDEELPREALSGAELDAELAGRFICPKCRTRGAAVRRSAATSVSFSNRVEAHHHHLIALSCTNCGYTELYNPDILESKRYLGPILKVLFGPLPATPAGESAPPKAPEAQPPA